VRSCKKPSDDDRPGTRCRYLSPTGAAFAVTKPINCSAASVANGGTIGFTVADPATVDEWHAAGVAGLPGAERDATVRAGCPGLP
jgi:hypothetical protein